MCYRKGLFQRSNIMHYYWFYLNSFVLVIGLNMCVLVNRPLFCKISPFVIVFVSKLWMYACIFLSIDASLIMCKYVYFNTFGAKHFDILFIYRSLPKTILF